MVLERESRGVCCIRIAGGEGLGEEEAAEFLGKLLEGGKVLGLLGELVEGGRAVEFLGELIDGRWRGRIVASGQVPSDERARIV